MNRVEYKIVRSWKETEPDTEIELNKLGNMGWELVFIQPTKINEGGFLVPYRIWYFKRLS